MGFMVLTRRNLKIFLIIFVSIIIVLSLGSFKTKKLIKTFDNNIQPAEFRDSQGNAFPIITDQSRSRGVAYVTILTDEGRATLEALVQSLQSHIIRKMEQSLIYIFYYKNTDPEYISALKLFRLVKTIQIDPFVRPLENLPPSQVQSNNKMARILPRILEYLLIEYPTVLFVESSYMTSEKTIPEVLKVVAKEGEVIVPGQDYTGRTAKLNPAISSTVFPLLAYTRSGFLERIKPYLDCEMGIYCQEEGGGETKKSLGPPRRASLLTKGWLALHKLGNGSKVSSKQKFVTNGPAQPLTVDFFENLRVVDGERIKKFSQKLKIGIGLDVSPEETFSDYMEKRLNPMIDSLTRQDYQNFLIIIYIVNYSSFETKNLKEILLKKVKLKGHNPGNPNNIDNADGDGDDDSLFIKVASEAATTAAGVLKEFSSTSAISDGCEHYYNFGFEAKIPKPSSKWLQSIVHYGVPKPLPLAMITHVSSNEEIWLLREIVGSIHGALGITKMSPPPLIIVIGSDISKENIEMINLWKHVEYHDLNSLLFGISGTSVKLDLNLDQVKVRLTVLETFISRYGSVLWVSPKVIIPDTAALEEMHRLLIRTGILLVKMPIESDTASPSLVLEGYDEESFSRIHGERLLCIKGIKCKNNAALNNRQHDEDYDSLDYERMGGVVFDGLKTFKLKSLLPKPSEDKKSQQYCHLIIRPEVMYNPVAFSGTNMTKWAHGKDDEETLSKSKKTKVAFLVPSKNKVGDKPGEIHLVQNFLTSMLKSIKPDEWNKFQYSIYIGYDNNDPILDKERSQTQRVMDEIIGGYKSSVLVKYHLLPTAKCVTLLWNILFIDAINDGNDYFYQLNDDVTIENPGWTSAFVKTLQDNNDFGVVGPNDRLWQCRLLTQSFVSRKHHEIFHWYFPMETKDWYSDNWISSVYGSEGTFCREECFIKNGASQTRYNICSEPRWMEAVTLGQERISAWKRQVDKKILDEKMSGQNK